MNEVTSILKFHRSRIIGKNFLDEVTIFEIFFETCFRVHRNIG